MYRDHLGSAFNGDSAMHFAGLKLRISPNAGNSDVQFLF